jgi:hypothetical protein
MSIPHEMKPGMEVDQKLANFELGVFGLSDFLKKIM